MASNVLARKFPASENTASEEAGSGHAHHAHAAAYSKARISIPVLCGLVGLSDAILILSSSLLAARYAGMGADNNQIVALIAGLGTILLLNLLHLKGAYQLEHLTRLRHGLRIVFFALAGTFITLSAVALAADVPLQAKTTWLPLWFAGAGVSLVLTRLVIRHRTAHWRRTGKLGDNVAIIGAGPIAQRLLYSMISGGERRCRLVGIFDDRKTRLPEHCAGHRVLGTVDDLLWEIRAGYVDSVIIALPLAAERRILEILNKLSSVAVDVRVCPDQFGLRLGRCTVSQMGDASLLNAIDRPLRDWRQIAKMVEDRVLAFLILGMISPLMAAIAALIKLDSPGPVFFKQKRWGYNNELIEVLKFRTMYHTQTDKDGARNVTRGDPRVTKLGAFLRRTSLDELPQFINVLKGDMSIVGPRPHALASTAGGLLFNDAVRFYDARHRMKPGITGWAQINGWRGETQTVEQIVRRVEHDLYYVEHWSVAMDLEIICRTIFGGFTGTQAY